MALVARVSLYIRYGSVPIVSVLSVAELSKLHSFYVFE